MYDRNKFLQANFRFLVSDAVDVRRYESDADLMLDWDDVVQVWGAGGRGGWSRGGEGKSRGSVGQAGPEGLGLGLVAQCWQGRLYAKMSEGG